MGSGRHRSETSPNTGGRFFFMAHQLPGDGYGYASIKIAGALARAGADVSVIDMRVNGSLPRMRDRRWRVEGPAVALCVPDWWQDIEAERLVGYTMFEATGLPRERVEHINSAAEACLVPCPWCKMVFLARGVRAPVHVARFGVDPEDYCLLERNGAARGDVYTFLWSGTPDYRKGWDVAYRAFLAAFGKREDVKLLLRFRKAPRGVRGFRDRNVEMLVGNLDLPGMRRLLQGADCFVYPARGEGWGLLPREAAATGLPVIATDWGGLSEEIEDWGLPLEVAGMRPAAFGYFEKGEAGEWAEPDLDHLVALMRWCFEEREAAAAVGRSAAEWTAENATWARTAAEMLGVLESVWG